MKMEVFYYNMILKKKLACRRQYNSVISALSKVFKTISVNRSDVKKDCTPFIPVYILNLKSVTKFCINSIILKISFQRQFEIGTLNYCFIWIWMSCQRIFKFFLKITTDISIQLLLEEKLVLFQMMVVFFCK